MWFNKKHWWHAVSSGNSNYRERNLPTASLPTTNLTSPAFTAKQDLCGEKPATSCLANCSTYISCRAVTHCHIIFNYFHDYITLSPIRAPLSVFRFNAHRQPNFLIFLLIHCLPHYITTFAWERKNVALRYYCCNKTRNDFFLDHKYPPSQSPPACFVSADIVRMVSYCRKHTTGKQYNLELCCENAGRQE